MHLELNFRHLCSILSASTRKQDTISSPCCHPNHMDIVLDLSSISRSGSARVCTYLCTPIVEKILCSNLEAVLNLPFNQRSQSIQIPVKDAQIIHSINVHMALDSLLLVAKLVDMNCIIQVIKLLKENPINSPKVPPTDPTSSIASVIRYS